MNKNKQDKPSLEQLMGKLKAEDSNYAAITKRFHYIFLVFIIFYAFITTLIFITVRDLNILLSGVSFMSSFVILAVVFRKYYKEYKFADYSLPTLQMLKTAEARYQLFNLRALWLLVAFGFLDVALTLNLMPWISVWTIQFIVLGIIVMAFVIGVIRWWYKYKPLLDQVRHLISEIESV